MATKEYHRAYRAKNKESYLASAQRNRARGKKFIDSLKTGPCADCGNTFHPAAMDFDHIKGEKLFSVASIRTSSKEVILAEVAKCELVCANCHRVRTWQRLQKSEVTCWKS